MEELWRILKGNQKKSIKVTQCTSAQYFYILKQASLKNKQDCVDVYCVTLIELQAYRDAFIQNQKVFQNYTSLW